MKGICIPVIVYLYILPMKKNTKANKTGTKFFLPRIVLKFRDDIAGSGKIGISFQKKLLSWPLLAKKFPGITIDKLFTSVEHNRILEKAERARQITPGYKPPAFLNYFSVRCPHAINADEVLNMLRNNEYIEMAYFESNPLPPPRINMGPGANPKSIEQGYLDPAPKGVNAKYAWKFNGGAGQGKVKFIDIEQGWFLGHEDIVDAKVKLFWGKNHEYQDHGAAVLGIILMQDNNKGGIGITPLVKANVISQISPKGNHAVHDAILKATDHLEFGDILLLEVQESDTTPFDKYWPAEIKPAIFHAIELATALGIIVIEAAGDGSKEENAQGNDLDNFKDKNDKYIFNRNSNDFKDSGAIIVGGASDSEAHGRIKSSNYGNRIDCYAWGSNVFTIGDVVDGYIPHFNGTSSASAIVAGVAIAVQSIAEAAGKKRLGPAQMRETLSHHANGTPSPDRIGVMPDLKKIIKLLIGSDGDD